MRKILFIGVVILAIATVSVRAECADGEYKQTTSSEEGGVSTFFKNVGCSIQKGVGKVHEGAKKLGGEIKEKASKFKDSAKKFGSDVKDKFEGLVSSSEHSNPSADKLFSQVELVDAKVLMAEQKCGKGFILDALGDCKKD